MRAALGLMAWFGIALSTLCAAAPRPLDLFDLSAPSFTSYTGRDGLPGSVQISLQADRDGFVWSSSPQGLAYYDGHRWRRVDDPGMGYPIYDLLLDHTGTLWAGFRDHGIARYDGSRWHLENRATGLPSEQTRRVVETQDTQGRYQLWVLTLDAGLLRRDGERWVADAGNAQLPAGPVLSLAQTHTLGGHERQWVGTFNEGVWFRDEGGAWQLFHADGFAPSQVEAFLVTHQQGHEALWISAYGGGIWRVDDSGAVRGWTKEAGDVPTNEVYDLAQTELANGKIAVWVATRSGLVRIYDEHAQVFDRHHGLPSDVVRDISAWRSPDGTDVLWLATEAGVGRALVGNNQWNTASLIGARANGVFGVYVDTDKDGGESVWVAATSDGLGLYEHGRWRYFTAENGDLPDTDARMILRADDEHGESVLWFGLRYGYLLRLRDHDRFERIDTPWERHPGQAVMDMLTRHIDGVYEQWFATRQSGVYRRRDGQWTAFRPDNAVGQWRAIKLQEQIDAQGRSWLWASTNQGLARYDGERWELFGRAAGLPDSELIGLSLIPDQTHRPILWAGSNHAGIVRVDVSDPRSPKVLPDSLPTAPDPTAYDALRDSSGRIFVCTNNGVQLLTPDGDGYASRVFNTHDGMLNDECNTNARFIDSHDRFWTGTLGGLTVFDPAGERSDRTPKPLHLTAVTVDDRPVPMNAVTLPAGQHDLRIEFALLSWQHEEDSRFRTQLAGYDAEAGAWTAQNYRDFNALPAGRYTLRIEARDYAGNASTPLELPIERVPAWWEHRVARASFALLGALILYALFRWRTHSLRAQRGRLEDKVARRTAELHEANSRLLELSYKDALTGLANRRLLLETLEARAGQPDADTALIFVDVDHFKDFNDHFGHPAGDEALRHVAIRMRHCAPADALVARYGGEEFACLLRSDDGVLARDVAEAMRAAVESGSVPLPGTEQLHRITISAGVARLRLDTAADMHRLLRAADVALYEAKRAGRNCVRG